MPEQATTCDMGLDSTDAAGPRPAWNLAARLLLATARWAQRRSPFHHGEGLRRTTDTAAYDRWRSDSLAVQLTDHFDPARLRSQDVLDFGSGSGELTLLVAERCKPRSVIGVDLSEEALARAERKAAERPQQVRGAVRFQLARDSRRIDLPDACVDFVLCFDVLEHVPHVDDTVSEWRRVLRPGGEVWIWWSPWRGPYGHHLESLIPLPWVHLLFRPRTIFSVCADLHDDPGFVPRHWDLDQHTGRKRLNKWRGREHFEPFLNRLTRTGFERIARRHGLLVVDRTTHGFRGSWPARATRPLTLLPGIGECFVSFFTYRLRKGR